jgi:membrane associated rhomboid family serine protease
MFPLRDTQPSYSRPVVTVLIILLNVLVFLFQVSLEPHSLDRFIALYGLVPADFAWVNVFTSMFLHGGWMHLIGNMWFLWVFGDNIEDVLGKWRYILFYLACGAAAGMAQCFLNSDSTVPMVGASGAIAGIMGAYMIKFPGARIVSLVMIVIFVTTVEVPAWLMLIFWFGTQFLNGVGSIGTSHASHAGGVAFMAHVGGFLAGIALILLMGPRGRSVARRGRNEFDW